MEYMTKKIKPVQKYWLT